MTTTSIRTIFIECKSCFQPTLTLADQFVRWFMNIEDNDFPKYVLFTDEASLRAVVCLTHTTYTHVAEREPSRCASVTISTGSVYY